MHKPSSIEVFMFHCKYEKNLSKKTLDAYGNDLKQYCSYLSSECLGTFDPKNAPLQSLKNYIQYLHKEYKPKSIIRKLAVLKAFYNHLEFEGIIESNPFRKVRLQIKDAETLPRVLDLNTIKALLQYLYRTKGNCSKNCPSKYKGVVRDLAIIELLFVTGIRVAKLTSIRLSDIDRRNMTIKIFGKGRRERIVSYAPRETVCALNEYAGLINVICDEQAYLFHNTNKKPISTDAVRSLIKRRVKEAGIMKLVTPHMFRHSVATLLLERGVDIRYIQSMLGHSSIVTTQIYTHINVKEQYKLITKNHPRNLLLLAGPK